MAVAEKISWSGYRLIHFFLGLIWLVNGLWCKILHGVPRHEHIVGEILGAQYASQWTWIIGMAEIVMAAWIWSGWRARDCAAIQIVVILVMNIMEWLMVPHLLLWGRWNLLFAILLATGIAANQWGRHHRKI